MAVEDAVPNSRDLYQRLGVSKQASTDEIKRHYRKLAMKWHPDKNPTRRDDAAEKFRLISQAYECLSDSGKRKDYDRFGIIPGESPDVSENRTGSRSGTGLYRTQAAAGLNPLFTDFSFTFDHAQRLFESVFGSDPFGDNDPFFAPMLSRSGPSSMGALRTRSLLNGPDAFFGSMFSDDLFGGAMSHSDFHSTLISSGGFGGESVSKQVTISNGRKTTRTEKTTVGSDGVPRRTVTEEVEDLTSHTHNPPADRRLAVEEHSRRRSPTAKSSSRWETQSRRPNARIEHSNSGSVTGARSQPNPHQGWSPPRTSEAPGWLWQSSGGNGDAASSRWWNSSGQTPTEPLQRTRRHLPIGVSRNAHASNNTASPRFSYYR